MDVLLKFSDELVPQNLNVCGSEFRQNNFLEVPHVMYSKMSRGTCFDIFGLTFISARIMSWSERPGRTVVLSMRVWFEVRKRSNIF